MNAVVLRRSIVLACVIGAGAAAIAFAPDLLRRWDVFRVRHVEVVGSRYVAPQTALERSGITGEANVFDDAAAWRRALMEHPVIEEVRIERRLPGTLVLRLREAEPIALVRVPELRMVAADGRVLPVDPAGREVDLPVVAAVSSEVGADGRLADPEARRLVGALARLRRFEAALADRVVEVGSAPGGAIRLLLTIPEATEVLVPIDAPAARLRALRLTLADLARRRDLSQVWRVDLRFRDQVVVSLTPSAAS
ncbi:MAG: cell division protein FtsQ/DivIB [Gemmatimonadota bacterium]